MRAIDTNILARFILDDDPHQSPIARQLVESGVHIPLTVMLETGWLLGSRYRQTNDDIAGALLAVLNLPGVTITQSDGVRWALERYAAGADLADMIHVVAASTATTFVTFDRGIAGAAGPDAPIAIETLR